MMAGKRYFFFILLFLNLISLTVFAQERNNQIFNPSTIKSGEVKTNTIRSDFGPSVVGDTLYFTSYSDKVLGKPDKKLRESAFYDLFRAKIDKDGNTISEREPVAEFLTKYHDGPVSYCENTGELFVTQSDNAAAAKSPKSNKKDTIRLRIVIAKKINGKWTSLTYFPYNNPAYSVGHPAISSTGDTLVFSSDQHGGFGQTDLYYSIRKGGKWSLPVNMGASINTSGKEEFSFITHNHTGGSFLVFASTRSGGFGGLDMYYTRFPFNNDKIEHFAAPINTPDDDFGMVIIPDAEFGYFSSNRPGTGFDDIYKFTFKKFAEPVAVKPLPLPMLPVEELYVFNTRTRKPIMDTKIITCDSALILTGPGGKAALPDNKQNECEVSATKFGFNPVKKLLIAKLVTKGELNRDTIWMDPIIGRVTLLNIYYDYDKSDVLPESAVELDRLIAFMNENPDLKVQLSSHTDSRGNDAYNMRLSEQRAQSAVKYIVSNGIKADRITGKGYGETQLVNKCANGVDCTPQEHRQNRRTEIFVPEIGKSNEVKQTEGDYSGVPDKKQNTTIGIKKEEKSALESISKVVSDKKAKKPTSGKISKAVHFTETNVKSDGFTLSSVAKIDNEQVSRTYFLVVGSFRQKANADRFLTKTLQKGFPAQIVMAKPYFRIGIAHKSFKEAKETLGKITGEYAGCWIL